MMKSLDSKVETLAEEKNVLKRRVDKLTKDLDEMEQYSRKSCLIFVGIEETGDIPKDTDKAIYISDVRNDNLGLNLTQEAIDRSHRLGPVRKARIQQGNEVAPSPRQIIVKFTNYHNKSMVFSNKRKLKGTLASIMENLTAHRVKLMQQFFKDVEKKMELKSPETPHPWETQHMPSPPPKNAGISILQTPTSPNHVAEAGARVSSP